MNALKKKIPGVKVGNRVECYHEGRADFKMTGHVTLNDAELCVIQRDDVPPVATYIGDGVTTRAKRRDVPMNIYIFGDPKGVAGVRPAVVLNRI